MFYQTASRLVLVILLEMDNAMFWSPVRGETCSARINAAAGDDLTTLRDKTFAAFRKECRPKKDQVDERVSCAVFTDGNQLALFRYEFKLCPLTTPFRLEFEVKTEYGAAIALAETKTEESVFADIRIGGMRNTKASVRPCYQDLCPQTVIQHDVVGLVDANEYRPFWIDYEGGVVKVGKGGQEEAFLEWDAGAHHNHVASQVHVGVASRAEPHGNWLLYQSCEH